MMSSLLILKRDEASDQRGDDNLVDLAEPVLVVMRGAHDLPQGVESVLVLEALVTNPQKDHLLAKSKPDRIGATQKIGIPRVVGCPGVSAQDVVPLKAAMTGLLSAAQGAHTLGRTSAEVSDGSAVDDLRRDRAEIAASQERGIRSLAIPLRVAERDLPPGEEMGGAETLGGEGGTVMLGPVYMRERAINDGIRGSLETAYPPWRAQILPK
jgi:hypothetical protein